MTSLTFLGIEFDTRQQASRLPEDKLVALRDRIQLLLRSKKVSLKELQEIVGL